MSASAMDMLLPVEPSRTRATRARSTTGSTQYDQRAQRLRHSVNGPLEPTRDDSSLQKERKSKHRGSRDDRDCRREPGVAARSSRVGSNSRDTGSLLSGSAQYHGDLSQPARPSSDQKSHSSSRSRKEKHVAFVDKRLPESSSRPPRRVDSRNSDFGHFGSWCNPASTNHGSIFEEWDSEPRHAPARHREPRLPAAPMSTDFAFYACSGDEEDRIGEEWYMAPKPKMDAQLEWAMAYIEEMKSGGAPRPLPRQR